MTATGDLFDQFQRSAWRLETRGFYEADAEEFQRFTQGLEPSAGQQQQRQGWCDRVAAATSEGRSIGRVLVVTLPLSPYLNWRITTAWLHAAAGEDIRIADLGAHPELAALRMDFWLLDDELVWVMDYDNQGRFCGRMATQVPTAVGACRRYRDLALGCSAPLAEFLTSR